MIASLALVICFGVAQSAWPVELNTVTMQPIVSGVAQVLSIDPGFKPVVDGATGRPVMDTFSGKPKMARTWANFMYFARKGKVVHLQSVKFEKIIPERKVACGAGWPTSPTTVLQQGKDGVMLTWPLAYEVSGVEFRLTVIYTTDERLAYPAPFPPNAASRSHTEVYKWRVGSPISTDPPYHGTGDGEPGNPPYFMGDMWRLFIERLDYFSNTPAGTCESIAVTPRAKAKILTFLYGYGSPELGNYQPGIVELYGSGNMVQAAVKLAALEEYLDSVCTEDCAALYAGGINAGTPDPNAEAVLDNPTVPANSLLLNDLWAVGRELGILGAK
jgi:hypothetical protein